MKTLALLTVLPFTWARGCCILSTISIAGEEIFATAEGTPSESCEGQWSDMICSEFELTYGVASIDTVIGNKENPPREDLSYSPTLAPSSSPSLPDLTPTIAPSFAPIQIANSSSQFGASEESGPKLSFRFADISGCGASRTCQGCITKSGCMWSDSGCTKSTSSIEQWCSPVPRADTVKQPCEALTGCNQCTVTAGCIWYRGSCSYSRGGGCDKDPQNCINYAWNCPAGPISTVPWVQPGYGPVPSATGGQTTGAFNGAYTPALNGPYIPATTGAFTPSGAYYGLPQYGIGYTAANLAVSSSGYVAPPYQPTSGTYPVGGLSYVPSIGASSFQPISSAPYRPAIGTSSFPSITEVPQPPNGLPSQLAVVGPLMPTSNANSQFAQSTALFPVSGPIANVYSGSNAGSSGLYPGAIVRAPANTAPPGSSTQPSGLYSSLTTSQSTPSLPQSTPSLPQSTPSLPQSTPSLSQSTPSLPQPTQPVSLPQSTNFGSGKSLQLPAKSGLYPSSSSEPFNSGLYAISDFISASSIHVFGDEFALNPTPSVQNFGTSSSQTPFAVEPQLASDTLYSKPTDTPKLPDPLPNRQQSSTISQYDTTPPSGELYQIAPLINYDQLEQSDPSPQQASQPTVAPTTRAQGKNRPNQNQQASQSLYQPTNYAPFESRPSQSSPNQIFGK